MSIVDDSTLNEHNIEKHSSVCVDVIRLTVLSGCTDENFVSP